MLDLRDRLNKECRRILSKQKLNLASFPNLELLRLALFTIYFLSNRHSSDYEKIFDNETVIRALKQESDLTNEEKRDIMEQINCLQEQNRREHNNLQTKFEELCQQLELERLNSQQVTKDLINKYETKQMQLEVHSSELHEENKRLSDALNQLRIDYEKLSKNDYERLEKWHRQIKLDCDPLINEDELLKHANSHMHQRRLQKMNGNGNFSLLFPSIAANEMGRGKTRQIAVMRPEFGIMRTSPRSSRWTFGCLPTVL